MFSEVKEAHRYRHDFDKITNFGCVTSKGMVYTLQGVSQVKELPEKVLMIFEKKMSVYVKTLRVV